MKGEIEKSSVKEYQSLYKELLEGIPDGIKVEEVICGLEWTMVRSEKGIGLAMTTKGDSRPRMLQGDLKKYTLKELAGLCTSWNMQEASIGVAAVNAYYNTLEVLTKHYTSFSKEDEEAFICSKESVIGEKVAVIGHFPYLETTIGKHCELHILERNPLAGDYIDPACEYLLPKMDTVFITGVTLINKTLPRLLELAQRAKVIMVGPSVPMSPKLFKYNIQTLAGFMVKDMTACIKLVKGESTTYLFDTGRRLQFKKNNNEGDECA